MGPWVLKKLSGLNLEKNVFNFSSHHILKIRLYLQTFGSAPSKRKSFRSNSEHQGMSLFMGRLGYLLPLTVSAEMLELTPVMIIILICALLVMSACLPACATLLLLPAFTLIQLHVDNVSQTWLCFLRDFMNVFVQLWLSWMLNAAMMFWRTFSMIRIYVFCLKCLPNNSWVKRDLLGKQLH